MKNGIMTRYHLILYLKGVAMGCADVVPGVSGGTVAFISGIYEELIATIRSLNPEAARLLFRFRLKEAWHHVNGTFLAVLLSGIGTSILIFSRVILHALSQYPEIVWAFFFGMIVASALMVGGKISSWQPRVIFWGLAGILAGYAVTVAVPAQTPETVPFIFFSGMVAICAMILPGISGSFILVLLSKYEFVFSAIRDFNLLILIVFASGCVVGIIGFSHVLHWTLTRYYNPTISLLTGLMLGALNKVWPWKQVLSTYTSSSGKVSPLLEHNVLPHRYFDLTGHDPHLAGAILLAITGFALVCFLEKLSVRKSPKRPEIP